MQRNNERATLYLDWHTKEKADTVPLPPLLAPSEEANPLLWKDYEIGWLMPPENVPRVILYRTELRAIWD